jgi:CBS domain-containing protein
MRIREVVAAKPDSTVVTVSPGATVRELVALLAEPNVGALVVCSDGATVEGIVSERDVVRRLHSEPDALSATVDTIMTSDVHTAGPDDSLDDMMSLMTDQRIRHVPVCDAGRMVGIISIGDVVKHRIKVLEFERDQLDSYVHQT